MSGRRSAVLAKALCRLGPVRDALTDPYFRAVARPVDAAWNQHGVTGNMSGFNPLTHAHYYPIRSLFHRWLTHPEESTFAPEEECQLAKEVLLFAHDYLHSWACRILQRLNPSFRFGNPATRDELATQAFFLIITEAVAVTGLDYWYLSVQGIAERCGTSFDLGPCTVNYHESLLDEYRRCNPTLTVQQPGFFLEVARLYCDGVIAGFAEQDLFENRPLADWLIRELLVAPRQREVSRLWIGQMSGVVVGSEELQEPFGDLLQIHRGTIATLGELLWEKIKHRVMHTFPSPENAQGYRFSPSGAVDYRFANLNRADARKVEWVSRPNLTECWHFYVDQVVSGREMPPGREARNALAVEVQDIKASFDRARLERLTDTLLVIDHPDPAPLELLFVN